jgi:GNAT superfamily N-acetyltransferase
MSTAPLLVDLSPEHAHAGAALSTLIGWNQTPVDWHYLLSAGRGRGVWQGELLIATAIVLPYAGAFGWIGMVLTNPSYRRRGLATLLLHDAMDWSRREGLAPALDATPAGEMVYRGLRFSGAEQLTRWRREARPAANPPALPAPAAPWTDAVRAAALAADAATLGVSRPALLDHLAHANGTRLWCSPGDATPTTWALGRPGRTAYQLGPLHAPDEARALTLVEAILPHLDTAVLLDVPQPRPTLTAGLQALGFREERPFLRMAADRPAPPLPPHLHAMAGPELG